MNDKVKNLHIPTLKEDTKQRIMTLFTLLLETSKVLMASLLVVFVPQRCSENVDGICTFMDNFVELTNYNKFVLAFNFLSLVLFIWLYKVEYNRENWCIEYLDIEPNKPNTNLRLELTKYDTIQKEMKIINNKYWYISLWTVILYTLNILFSAILIYSDYYLDYRSITVLVTNVILVGDKLYNCIITSKKSADEEIACSAYLKTAIVFNTVDRDYQHLSTFPSLEPISIREDLIQDIMNEDVSNNRIELGEIVASTNNHEDSNMEPREKQ